ncbi:methyltransferase domain-containing protein [Candidatus Woesearchaeota archaeon]|nr:methyltransferase domain-containing protein [Candidatus Woesearchaeota archaeon]
MGKSIIVSANRQFFDRWAPHYDWSPFQWWMRKFHRAILTELKRKQTPAIILDVSCGTGELLKSITVLNMKHRLYGVDLSSRMVAMARKKLPTAAKLFSGDVHQLPFRSNTFDYVLNTESFHHYVEQEQALRELNRVTKPGGKIIISELNFLFWPAHWLFQKLEPGCVKINSRKEMRELFVGAGLRHIVQSRNFLFSVTTEGVKL